MGAPSRIAGLMIDELTSTPEEKFFGEAVPIDIGQTGGTIPKDIGDFEDFRELVTDLKNLGKEFTKKTH